jgi:hypothetical protein
MLRRQDFLGRFASLPLLDVAVGQAGPTRTINALSARAQDFHRAHPICDMLGLNLIHPRFLIDNIDLGRRNEDTYRGVGAQLVGVRTAYFKWAVPRGDE